MTLRTSQEVNNQDVCWNLLGCIWTSKYICLLVCAFALVARDDPFHRYTAVKADLSKSQSLQRNNRAGGVGGLFLGCHDIITGHLRISLVREEDEGFGRSV